MPKAVEDAIEKVKGKGFSEASAIRILKSNHAIVQSGRHLAEGPSLHHDPHGHDPHGKGKHHHEEKE